MGLAFANQRLGLALAAGSGVAYTGLAPLSNSNGISFGMQASASSNVVTASLDALRRIVVGANTLTGIVVFGNANGISFGLNGQTLTANRSKVSYWDSPGERNATVAVSVHTAGAASTFSVQRFSIPYAINVTQIDLVRNLSVSGSASATYSWSYGFYTMTGSSAFLASSAVLNVSFASGTVVNVTAYGGHSGTRYRSVGLTDFGNATFNLTPGEYLFAFGVQNVNSSISYTVFGRSSISIAGGIGGAAPNYFCDGIMIQSTSIGVGMLTSFHMSNITQTGVSALGQPYFRLIGS